MTVLAPSDVGGGGPSLRKVEKFSYKKFYDPHKVNIQIFLDFLGGLLVYQEVQGHRDTKITRNRSWWIREIRSELSNVDTDCYHHLCLNLGMVFLSFVTYTLVPLVLSYKPKRWLFDTLNPLSKMGRTRPKRFIFYSSDLIYQRFQKEEGNKVLVSLDSIINDTKISVCNSVNLMYLT